MVNHLLDFRSNVTELRGTLGAQVKHLVMGPLPMLLCGVHNLMDHVYLRFLCSAK